MSDIWSAALRAALVTSSRTLIQSGGHRRTPNQIGHFASAKQVCGRFRLERLEVFGSSIDAARREWDCPIVIVTLDAKRRLSIPITLAPAKPGDRFDATLDAEEDTVILRRVPKKRSWLEVLKRCPASMDDLPPRTRELPKKLKL